jgi:predicted short-subunit dehydrogenase-like oxidoreductase (DUF2520 family)
MPTDIAIAGAGRVAQALGRLLRERGEPVVAVASRNPEHARAAAAFIGGVEAMPYTALPRSASRVIVAVSDDAIRAVAAALAAAGMRTGEALHISGALGPEALAPLAAHGVSCATLHPLQTVATPEQGVEALPGSYFGVAGEGEAAAWAERTAALLGGHVLRIPAGSEPLYHAAAVMASNYVVALVDAAAAILKEAAGVAPEDALAALAPLVKASADNALQLGPERALTGPIERGDRATIEGHVEALGAVPPRLREFYRAAGLHALDVARRRGLDEARARGIEDLLRRAGEEHD